MSGKPLNIPHFCHKSVPLSLYFTVPKSENGYIRKITFPIISSSDGHESDVISSAVEAVDASGKALGYIFNITTSKGYGGDIQLTVGIQSDGTVSGYSKANSSLVVDSLI